MTTAPRPAPPRPLAGFRIVVTRPVDQAESLAERIRAEGGAPTVFPVLEIADVADVKPILAIVDRLETFDLAVFISPNAVNKAMNLITARRSWPAGLRAAAIGRGSERELRRYRIAEVIAPAGRFDSEALLALPALQAVQGWRVIIFRGDGGRELLGDALRARGATVEYAECYRRRRPDADVAPLLRAWARGDIDAVIVTSSEGLRNLYDMVGKLGQQWLRRTPVFVPHARIAESARALGLERVIETPSGDDGVLTALREFRAGATVSRAVGDPDHARRS